MAQSVKGGQKPARYIFKRAKPKSKKVVALLSKIRNCPK